MEYVEQRRLKGGSGRRCLGLIGLLGSEPRFSIASHQRATAFSSIIFLIHYSLLTPHSFLIFPEQRSPDHRSVARSLSRACLVHHPLGAGEEKRTILKCSGRRPTGTEIGYPRMIVQMASVWHAKPSTEVRNLHSQDQNVPGCSC